MPEVAGTHPSPRQLAEYALGKLDAGEMAAVSEHLADCPACRETVDAHPPDSFVGQLMAAAKGGTLPPGSVRRSTGLGPGELPPALVGSGKYEVLGKLGQGGMGSVWKARHTFLKQLVAIKVMNAEASARDEVRARFLREMQATAGLRHPHIVRALDAEALGEHLILVMEYVEGITLDKLVAQKGPVPALYACQWGAQAAEGLQYAHEQGLVHRDVKPANLMITRDTKDVKILDFGLARGPREPGATGARTRMQMFMGTPEYVAPEQAKDARSADIRADIYSLGCTLFYLLAGKPPFERDNALETVLAHAQDTAPPLGVERPGLPAELVGIVARMMEKEPPDRFQTPGEVAKALGRIARGEGAEKSSAPPRRLADLTADPPAIPVRPRSPSRRPAPAKKRPVGWKLIAGLLFVGLCLTGLAGYLLTLNLDGKVEVRVEVAEPGCKVSWDGKLLTVGLPEGGPIKVQVLPGQEYRLKVEKDGFETVTDSFVYKKGGEKVVRVEMKPLQAPGGRLALEVSEAGAEVLLDGVKQTAGPGDGKTITITRKPGTYELQVRKAGFVTYRRAWECLKGETERLVIQLARAELGPPPPPPIVTRPVRKFQEVTNSIGMRLADIPAGTFLMGSPDGEATRIAAEGPQHEVEITRPFWMGRFEVTQSQFKTIMAYNPSYCSRDGSGLPPNHYIPDQGPGQCKVTLPADTADFPVENLSSVEAMEFCARLSQRPAERAAGRRYRLPTEAEWEYACRAGAKDYTVFSFGNGASSREANFNGSHPYGGATEGVSLRRTTKVGSYGMNAFGLFDMHGNVCEWCSDWYDKDYYKNSPRFDPTGAAESEERMWRGGSWDGWGYVCRSACRGVLNPNYRLRIIGFRVVMEQGPPGKFAKADFTSSIGLELMRIRAGKCLIGSPINEPGRGPYEGTKGPVWVTIREPFYLGKFEVTQKQFKQVMGWHSSHFSHDGTARPGVEYKEWHDPAGRKDKVPRSTDDYPVEVVSFQEAEEFCRRLTDVDRKAGVIDFKQEYRLPNEDEWEYACRAGEKQPSDPYHFGKTIDAGLANCGPAKGVNHFGQTCRVGTYPANAFGLHDLHGNVWEWCYTSRVLPLPKNKEHRVRGGTFFLPAGACRSACRIGFLAEKERNNTGSNNIGFRVMLARVGTR